MVEDLRLDLFWKIFTQKMTIRRLDKMQIYHPLSDDKGVVRVYVVLGNRNQKIASLT